MKRQILGLLLLAFASISFSQSPPRVNLALSGLFLDQHGVNAGVTLGLNYGENEFYLGYFAPQAHGLVLGYKFISDLPSPKVQMLLFAQVSAQTRFEDHSWYGHVQAGAGLRPWLSSRFFTEVDLGVGIDKVFLPETGLGTEWMLQIGLGYVLGN